MKKQLFFTSLACTFSGMICGIFSVITSSVIYGTIGLILAVGGMGVYAVALAYPKD